MKQSIDNTAKKYINRRKDESLKELSLKKAKDYLIEECPAIIWLGAKRSYNFIVYPGEIVEALESSRNFFIVDKNLPSTHSCYFQVEQSNKLLNWLEVNFKRKHEEKLLAFVQASKMPTLTTEIIKGAALAIFTLPYDESTKIALLAKFSAEYFRKVESYKVEKSDVQKPFNEFTKKINQELNSALNKIDIDG